MRQLGQEEEPEVANGEEDEEDEMHASSEPAGPKWPLFFNIGPNLELASRGLFL